MSTPRRRAEIRIDGRRCGELVETQTGVRFRYDAAWLADPNADPISLTLPLQPEPHDATPLHAFFANLLPEGWLLDIATTALKVSADDVFGILIATCAECIGAVEVIADGTAP